jgi:hypothetical protein
MSKIVPYFGSAEEAYWYDKTPKRVLFALARDYANENIGETETINSGRILEELSERAKTLKRAGYDR